MRRRLTVAVIALVVATVALTSIGSYVLIRRATVQTAERELQGEARAISHTLSDRSTLPKVSFRKELAVVASAGDFTSVQFVLLAPDGTVEPALEAGLTPAEIDPAALLAGTQVTGHTRGLLTYSAVPTPLRAVTDGTPVLVVSRQVHSPVDGLRYFGLIGLLGVVAAALVAAALARRFTRPVVDAVATTGRMAAGDLDARVEVRPHEDPEFRQLAASINAMGGALARARDQERQFLLSVSHELRTPLTSIRGYAEAVLDGTLEDTGAAARVIDAEARRLERLVQDLLDLARLHAHRFELDLRAVDAAETVRRVVGGFVGQAADRGLTLGLAPGTPDTCPVVADADRLGQVVANLVENAVAFADRRVEVGVAADAGHTLLWVDDDGPGIPGDDLKRVFDRHVTSDRERTGRQGTGLGLAIVAELTTAMGGSVSAESPIGPDRIVGSRFLVRLPAADSPLPTRVTEASPQVESTPHPEVEG